MNLQEIPVQKLIAELNRRGYEIKEPENKDLLKSGLMLHSGYLAKIEKAYNYFGLAPPEPEP